MSDIDALIERLEKATGPDREIDAMILVVEEPRIFDLLPYWTPEERENIVPRYTESIDAAVALVERVLPEKAWAVNGNGRAYITEMCAGATPAIALCVALLVARKESA